MSEERMAYVGKCRQCHGAYMMVIDNPEHDRDVAKEVEAVINAGDTIERMTVEAARASWSAHTCQCESVEDLEVDNTAPLDHTAELERLAAWNSGQPRKVGR